MKRLFTIFATLLALGFASAQQTVSLEGADETVRLWDNTTAKHSNHQTRDEQFRKGRKNSMPDGEKPAFAIINYAWINLHKSSTLAQDEALKYILGKSYTEQDAINLSTHYMVSATTSPTIQFLCYDDSLVPSTDGVEYYEALVRHGVKASMHIFPFGGHSVNKHTAEYKPLVLDWLRYLGFIDEK